MTVEDLLQSYEKFFFALGRVRSEDALHVEMGVGMRLHIDRVSPSCDCFFLILSMYLVMVYGSSFALRLPV